MEWLGGAIPDNRAKFPVLMSYAYLRKADKKMREFLLGNTRTEIILDSGAFTALNAGAEIDLGEYMEFLDEHKSKLFGYFALDKLGDPEVTEKNFEIMKSRGLKPIPIHVRGDNEERMNYLFNHSDWVGCGGFRRPHRGPAPKSYVMEKMRWANGRNVHWLGYTTTTMIKAFRPYSCDSSSWNASLMYGQLKVYLGAGRWTKGLTHKDFQKIEIDPRLRQIVEESGMTIQDARNPKRWRCDTKGEDPGYKKFFPLQVGLYSWVRYVRDVRAKLGTRFFLAIAYFGYAEHMYKFIDLTDKTEIR